MIGRDIYKPLPLPPWFIALSRDPNKLAPMQVTKFGTKPGDIAIDQEAAQSRKQFGLRPVKVDLEGDGSGGAPNLLAQNALVIIDGQVGFTHPDASLYVPGADQDMLRIAKLVLEHLPVWADILATIDTHQEFQNFHPIWFEKQDGSPIDIFTSIDYQKAISGQYRIPFYPQETLDYLRQLSERTPPETHQIWPFHCLYASEDLGLHPMLRRAIFHHSIARLKQPSFEPKGNHPWSEQYSALEVRVDKIKGQVVGQLNQAFLNKLKKYNRVVIAGEAMEYCVLATIRSLLQNVDQGTRDKVRILTDCMSVVPPSDRGQVEQTFQGLASQYGVRLHKSTDGIETILK